MALHKQTLKQAVKIVEILKDQHITKFHKQCYLYRLIEDVKFPNLKNHPYFNRPGSSRVRGGNAYIAKNFESIINMLISNKILTREIEEVNGVNRRVKYNVNQKSVLEFLKEFGSNNKN